MKKILIRCFLVGALLLFFLCRTATGAFASSDFETSQDIRYQVESSGSVHVTQKISLTNKLSKVYAKNYSLILQLADIKNVTASDGIGPMSVDVQIDGDQTKVSFTFNEKVVGKGKTLNFNLSYDILDLAQKKGQIWEVTIPKLGDIEEIDRYRLTLAIHHDLGQPAYISPNPEEKSEEGKYFIYFFNKDQLKSSAVSAVFGEFQIFDFVLSYHLRNPDITSSSIQIALPPDTAYQRLTYKKIDPPPDEVVVDPDGNWLASYRVKGSTSLLVTAIGKVKIFAKPKDDFPMTSEDVLIKNLSADKFWPVDNDKIKRIAEGLKSPEDIYRYVIKTLSYDYHRMEKEVKRLGGLKALERPQECICMEFTDLFISLARASGIPAREVNGFAYTTNPRLQPLSMVTDVLHSWPEYYDKSKGQWIPVDPTWEKTTGGIDYFHKFDLNHFSFAIHGVSSESPSPAGSYKTDETSKDVQIIFGQYEPEIKPELEINLEVDSGVLFKSRTSGELTVENKGPSAIYLLPLSIKSKNVKLSLKENLIIDFLPPFGVKRIPFEINSSLLDFGQGSVEIFGNGQEFAKTIQKGSSASFILVRIIFPIFALIVLTFVFINVKNKLSKKRNF